MIEAFMFLLGVFFASIVWLVARTWREYRDHQEELREAELMVEKIWFGDDRE